MRFSGTTEGRALPAAAADASFSAAFIAVPSLLEGRVFALGARAGRSRPHCLGAYYRRGGWSTIVLAFVRAGRGLDWLGGAHDQRFCGWRAGALAAVAQGSGCYR